MDRIYADSENKYVKNTVLYVGGTEPYVYLDKAGTKKIDAMSLLNYYTSGVLFSNVEQPGFTYYAPLSIELVTGKNTGVKPYTLVRFDFNNFYSEEYVVSESGDGELIDPGAGDDDIIK